MSDIIAGVVVRATDWPGTKGERYLVRQIRQQPQSGLCADLSEFDGGTPFRYRCIPVAHLRVDTKATRERQRRMAAEAAAG